MQLEFMGILHTNMCGTRYRYDKGYIMDEPGCFDVYDSTGKLFMIYRHKNEVRNPMRTHLTTNVFLHVDEHKTTYNGFILTDLNEQEVPDLSQATEEEMFQLSLIYAWDLELLQAFQNKILLLLNDK